MRKHLQTAAILLLAGGGILSGIGLARQSPATSTAAFPEQLLEGAPDFNLAILLQSDLRGNFGPCG